MKSIILIAFSQSSLNAFKLFPSDWVGTKECRQLLSSKNFLCKRKYGSLVDSGISTVGHESQNHLEYSDLENLSISKLCGNNENAPILAYTQIINGFSTFLFIVHFDRRQECKF